MLKLEKFKTMNDLVKYQKELYTSYTDSDVYDDVKDKILEEILEVGNFIEDTTTTNKKLLETLLSVVNLRKDEYQLQILAEGRKYAKKYKFNNFNDIEIEEKPSSLTWNAVIIAKKDVDVLDYISPNEKSSLFFRPGNYKNLYKEKLLVTYDAFLGNVGVDEYMNSEQSISKLTEIGQLEGLTVDEIKLLSEKILDLYKDEYNKVKEEKGKVRIKKVGE